MYHLEHTRYIFVLLRKSQHSKKNYYSTWLILIGPDFTFSRRDKIESDTRATKQSKMKGGAGGESNRPIDKLACYPHCGQLLPSPWMDISIVAQCARIVRDKT